jgi:UDP-2-acetamido-3-amino-2,3-dideoxy-glucuronate N-acetyltransferase
MINTFIHETAIIDDNAVIGEGTKIWAFSHISKGAKIGKNCVIGEGVHIGPGVIIGDNCKIQNHSLLYEGVTLENNVFLGPNIITTNDLYPKARGEWTRENFKKTLFKEGCSIGANSTIICGVIIGNNTLIGAGSVVTKNIPSGVIAYGNPTKIKNKIK